MNIKQAAFLAFGLICTSQHALAFDCTQATNDSEVAICGHPELMEINDSMEVTFQELRENLNYDDFIALRSVQRDWLLKRDAQCLTDFDCLLSSITDRQDLLSEALRTALGNSEEALSRDRLMNMVIGMAGTITRLLSPKDISKAMLTPDAVHYRLNLRTFDSSISESLKEDCRTYPITAFDEAVIEGNKVKLTTETMKWTISITGPRTITIDRINKDFELTREATLQLYYDTQNGDWRSAKKYIPQSASCTGDFNL